MTITVPIYSEQPLTRDAQSVINAVLKEYPPHTFEFLDLTPYVSSANASGIHEPQYLVFGNTPTNNPDAAVWAALTTGIHCKVIHTYSMAQLMTKANAATVLKAALDQFYYPAKVHPKKPGPFRNESLNDFDLDAPIVIDIETSGNLDEQTPEEVGILTVSFYQDNKWAVWQFYDNGPTGLFKCFGGFYPEILGRIKRGVFHNAKFDVRVLEAVFEVRVPVYFDTMLAHHALNQAAGDHKLKHLCRQYLGAPEWEVDLKKYTTGGAFYENIPKHLLIEYNAWDVYWTWELWKYLEPQILISQNASKAFMLEMAAADMLLEVEQKGFAIDRPYTRTLQAQMQADVMSKLAQLQGMTAGVTFKKPLPFNPDSWQQVQMVLSQFSGITYSGSTDEKHLLEYQKQIPNMKLRSSTGVALDIFITRLLEYRGVRKALSTYVEGALKHEVDGRMHTTFLIHGTTTGRLSSSGINMQNIPRDKKFRRIFIG